jgi:hypothetical protein
MVNITEFRSRKTFDLWKASNQSDGWKKVKPIKEAASITAPIAI